MDFTRQDSLSGCVPSPPHARRRVLGLVVVVGGVTARAPTPALYHVI